MTRRLAHLLVVFSGCGVAAVFALSGARAHAAAPPDARVLRVCADPNNLPFSNDKLEGFENRLADIVAAEMRARVAYTWWAQRRGFVRNTIKSHACDVLMGVPAGFDMTLVTTPYYRSSYVFVTRRRDHFAVRSLDDPVLRRVRVGVQLVGNDGQNTPPAHALAARGVISNVVGYTLYGNYLEANPPARIVEAVARGDIDVAVVWGPLAGYHAPRQDTPLEIRPVTPQIDRTSMPLAFDIGVGVSRAHPELLQTIDAVLKRKRAEIGRLLDDYGVPRVPALAPASATGDAHGR
jgi:quinoprotein dehydrogenase-associated probable ABC transporter substrate-binding protein